MRASEDLAELIARVAMQDRTSFYALYQRMSPKLFAICIRILGERSEAEDALQEIFVRIWQRAGTYSADGRSPSGWLSTIARNHAIDRLRQRKPVSKDIEEAFDLADDADDPEQSAHLKSEGRRIDHCMDELEPDCASAVKEAYVSGLSYQELAERYTVPLNTMRTRLRRSLMKLKECLEQ